MCDGDRSAWRCHLYTTVWPPRAPVLLNRETTKSFWFCVCVQRSPCRATQHPLSLSLQLLSHGRWQPKGAATPAAGPELYCWRKQSRKYTPSTSCVPPSWACSHLTGAWQPAKHSSCDLPPAVCQAPFTPPCWWPQRRGPPARRQKRWPRCPPTRAGTCLRCPRWPWGPAPPGGPGW